MCRNIYVALLINVFFNGVKIDVADGTDFVNL